MSDWYYSRNEDEREGPVSEERILELIADRTLKPRSLVWREGMAEWTEVRREFKRTSPRATSTPKTSTALEEGCSEIPSGLPGWMLFIAILSIVCGIATIGFGLGIFLILGGSFLLKARNLLKEMSSIDPAWEEVLKKLRGYFMMLGLCAGCFIILLGIVLVIVS